MVLFWSNYLLSIMYNDKFAFFFSSFLLHNIFQQCYVFSFSFYICYFYILLTERSTLSLHTNFSNFELYLQSRINQNYNWRCVFSYSVVVLIIEHFTIESDLNYMKFLIVICLIMAVSCSPICFPTLNKNLTLGYNK